MDAHLVRLGTTDDLTDVDQAARCLGELLTGTHRSLGVADSLTGGLLVQALARIEGSDGWLTGGIVASRRSVEHDVLEVGLDDRGSRGAAASMAGAVRRRLGSDVGLAVGGRAPRDGEPPGAVWMAVDLGDGATTELLVSTAADPEALFGAAVVASIGLAARQLESAGPPPQRDDGFLRRNALSIACFSAFALFLIAQSLTGWRSAVADAAEHGEAGFGYWRYLTTGHFAEATFENWESEFLQMGAFVFLTIFLLQKGSGESKQDHDDPRDEDPRHHRHDPGAPWPVRRGGWWLAAYENSLLIAFTVLFVGSFVGHAVSGAHEHSAEQHEHGGAGVGAWQFVRSSEFWFQSFQNWQSEFLAVGAIVVLSVFLRQRGSAESKPVHAPHRRSGDE